MFDWIGDLIDAIAEAIREAFEFLGTQISNTIWNTMLRWFYETIYDAVADFFTMMGNMGADIFPCSVLRCLDERRAYARCRRRTVL